MATSHTREPGGKDTFLASPEDNSAYERIAILASETPRAQEALAHLTSQGSWVALEEADAVVVLGGDGFMLQTLHAMLDAGRVVPAYGMNLGTVGFLMNRYDKRAAVRKRLA
ncbi:MAG: NAD(+)/NADH kinase, partial [Pseudomonadota bacterium]